MTELSERINAMKCPTARDHVMAYIWAYAKRAKIVGEWDEAGIKWAKLNKYAGQDVASMTPIELTTLAGKMSARPNTEGR